MPERPAPADRSRRSRCHPAAERTINDYLDVATGCARRSGLRRLQQDAWDQHRGAVGVQRSFAETVTAYLERKLAEE